MNPSAATSATPLPTSERDRLGSIALDQWRGLALLLVLISHGLFFTGRVNGIGRVGVNLFFFISGVLVFRSLSRTRAKSAWERTHSFWWRRLRRLYPATVTYVLAMLPLAWLLQQRPDLPPDSDFFSYVKTMPAVLLYVVNYREAPMALGHLWSLACEMQFYLLAPVIFLLGGPVERRRRFVFGCLLAILLGLGAVQPLIGKWKFQFEFAAWPMMLGFCCEYKRDWLQKIPEWLVPLISRFCAVVCAAGFGFMLFGLEAKSLVVATGALLLVPCWLAYLCGRPMSGILGAGAEWLGERTYSIYLWQQPLTICDYLPAWLHPFGALAAIPAGGAWFRWFEWPFLTASRRGMETLRPSHNARNLKSAAIGLAVFAVLLLTSAATLRGVYENRLARRIWPAVAPEISIRSNSPAHPAPTVLLLGDSRVAQWDLPQLPGWRVVNAGADGLTTGQLRLCAPKLLDEFHPDAVVLEAGINDLKYLGLCPEMAPRIISLAASNLAAVVHECAARRCQVIVLATWPAGPPSLARWLVWSVSVSDGVAALNAQLQSLDAPEQGIRVVDLFRGAGLNPTAALYRDTLHFKPEVYQRLTPVLKQELDAASRGSPKSSTSRD